VEKVIGPRGEDDDDANEIAITLGKARPGERGAGEEGGLKNK